jgi:hypothetical protein
MKVRLFLFIFVFVFFVVIYAFDIKADEIGYVKKVEGSASIFRNGLFLPVTLGRAVELNDLIQTDKNGAVGITFKDSTMISIGPDTEFVVDDYVYKPADKKFSFASTITRGTLHFVSGNIAKRSLNSVQVRTPEGTIGLQGTRFLVKVKGD